MGLMAKCLRQKFQAHSVFVNSSKELSEKFYDPKKKVTEQIKVIILSINVVSVHNFFLSWGADTNSIESNVEANLQAAESAAVNAAQDIENNVEYAAAEAESGISSLYERLRGKMEYIRANISELFDLDVDFQSPDYYMNKLFNLAPPQLSVVQDMLRDWTQRAHDFAQEEWEFRRTYLTAAKEDLQNTLTALNNGDFDSAMEYFQSAMINVRDESAIYRALQYAWEQDPTMIPLVSNLSASLLESLEFDLSDEVKSD